MTRGTGEARPLRGRTTYDGEGSILGAPEGRRLLWTSLGGASARAFFERAVTTRMSLVVLSHRDGWGWLAGLTGRNLMWIPWSGMKHKLTYKL